LNFTVFSISPYFYFYESRAIWEVIDSVYNISYVFYIQRRKSIFERSVMVLFVQFRPLSSAFMRCEKGRRVGKKETYVFPSRGSVSRNTKQVWKVCSTSANFGSGFWFIYSNPRMNTLPSLEIRISIVNCFFNILTSYSIAHVGHQLAR